MNFLTSQALPFPSTSLHCAALPGRAFGTERREGVGRKKVPHEVLTFPESLV